MLIKKTKTDGRQNNEVNRQLIYLL